MAKWSEMSSTAQGAVAAVVVAVLGFAGYAAWHSGHSGPKPAADAVQATADAPKTDAPKAAAAAAPADSTQAAAAPAAAAPAAAADAKSADATAPAPAAPATAVTPAPKAAAFDVVRVDPDGTTTIAGQGEPGAKISLQIDGAEVGAATVGADGKFAAVFSLPVSAQPRMLASVETLADGSAVPGGAGVAINPVVAPAPQVAAADTTKTAEAPQAAAPTAVVVDDKGVTVAQSGTAGALGLAAIAYDDKGRVQLAGTAAPGDTVRIYLNNALTATTGADAKGGWQSSPDIAPGQYTLRLDETDPKGKVVARMETPFQRETLEALAAASGAAPAAAPAVATDTKVAAATETAPATTVPAADATAPAPAVAAADTTTAADTTAAATTAPAQAAPAAATAAPAVAASADQTTAQATEEPVQEPAAETAPDPGKLISITVKPGFTLWGIAKAHMGKGIMYVQIFDANKRLIKNPDLIYPGQVFIMPPAN